MEGGDAGALMNDPHNAVSSSRSSLSNSRTDLGRRLEKYLKVKYFSKRLPKLEKYLKDKLN